MKTFNLMQEFFYANLAITILSGIILIIMIYLYVKTYLSIKIAKPKKKFVVKYKKDDEVFVFQSNLSTNIGQTEYYIFLMSIENIENSIYTLKPKSSNCTMLNVNSVNNKLINETIANRQINVMFSQESDIFNNISEIKQKLNIK